MFTWICPKCGREVPPAYSECPDCAAQQEGPATGTSTAEPEAVAAPPPHAAVPETRPPAPPAPPPAPPAAPPRRPGARRPGLPTWLMSVLFAIAFTGLGLGAYWLFENFRAGRQAVPVRLESPGSAAHGKGNPLEKYIEVTGFRLLEERGKPQIRFVVVNHSGADITDLGATVSIWGRTDKSEEEAVGNFSFRLPALGPYEVKDLGAPLNTKLRAYEMPDWQNVSGQVQITSPQ